MARWPTPKIAVNDANAPAYNPDDPNRDKVGIYAEDFHDLAEVIVNKKDPNYWDSQKMTKRSIYPESVFAYEMLIAGEEWNDLDNDHTNWTAGNASTSIQPNITAQLEGAGCLQLYANGAAPTAYRSFTAENWSAFVRCALALRTNKTNEVITIRVGTNSSNYWQFKVLCPQANRWYSFDLELNGSGYGIPPESTTGSPNIAQIGYIYIQGTTTSDALLLVDAITLHPESYKARRESYDPLAVPPGVIVLGDCGTRAGTVSDEDATASSAGSTGRTVMRLLIPADFGVRAIMFTARYRSATANYTAYVTCKVNGTVVAQLSTTMTSYVNGSSGWIRFPQVSSGIALVEIHISNTGAYYTYLSSAHIFLRR